MGEKKISFRSFMIRENMWWWTGYRTGKEGTIGLAELKKFCSKINCKVSNSVLREKFTKYDAPNTGEIGFDDFCNILQELLLGNKSLYLETFGRWVIFLIKVEFTQRYTRLNNRLPKFSHPYFYWYFYQNISVCMH